MENTDDGLVVLQAALARVVQDAMANGRLQGNSATMARAHLASAMGQMFNGERDIYLSAGYKRILAFEDFYAEYRRGHIAKRIIDAPAVETWREWPMVTDTDNDDEEDTPFTAAWGELADAERVQYESLEDETTSVWSYLERADKLSGIGQFALIVLGIADGRDLIQPLQKGAYTSTSNKRKLLYMQVYHQGNVEIGKIETDTKSPRFGKPVSYRINMGDITDPFVLNTDGKSEKQPESDLQANSLGWREVHWTRCVVVAEDPIENELFGTPRLENIYNLLQDLLKITAATGEAAWKLMYKGIIATTKDGYALPDTPAAQTDTERKLAEYVHGLVRYLEVEGMDVNIEGGEIVNPAPVIEMYIGLIAAARGFPQRILMGSERGELASSQDEKNWKERIETRQANHAGPNILRPVIRRLIYAGVLPPPQNGRVRVIWPSLFSVDPKEEAEVNKLRAETLKLLAPAGATDNYMPDPNEARELAGLPPLEEDEIADILDSEDAADPPPDDTETAVPDGEEEDGEDDTAVPDDDGAGEEEPAPQDGEQGGAA